MRTAPVRAGSIGATPAFHGQRGLEGEPVANRYRPKTIANRQTDRPGIRRRQQRRAHRPRLAPAAGAARKGRRPLQGQRLRRHRPLHVGGNPVNRTAPIPGTAGESTGNPAGKGICPTPPDTIARQAAATYRREKFGIPHQNRYLRIIPHTLRAYCGGQYSPPGMRLSGKSTA